MFTCKEGHLRCSTCKKFTGVVTVSVNHFKRIAYLEMKCSRCGSNIKKDFDMVQLLLGSSLDEYTKKIIKETKTAEDTEVKVREEW